MNDDMFFGATPTIFQHAEVLRSQMTSAEGKLWEQLAGKKMDGFKFRRQHPINIFIADFYCHQKKLVIELDGGIHNEQDQSEYDIGRSEELTKLGIKVIRFTNEEVMNNMESVLKSIREMLKGL